MRFVIIFLFILVVLGVAFGDPCSQYEEEIGRPHTAIDGQCVMNPPKY